MSRLNSLPFSILLHLAWDIWIIWRTKSIQHTHISWQHEAIWGWSVLRIDLKLLERGTTDGLQVTLSQPNVIVVAPRNEMPRHAIRNCLLLGRKILGDFFCDTFFPPTSNRICTFRRGILLTDDLASNWNWHYVEVGESIAFQLGLGPPVGFSEVGYWPLIHEKRLSLKVPLEKPHHFKGISLK